MWTVCLGTELENMFWIKTNRNRKNRYMKLPERRVRLKRNKRYGKFKHKLFHFIDHRKMVCTKLECSKNTMSWKRILRRFGSRYINKNFVEIMHNCSWLSKSKFQNKNILISYTSPLYVGCNIKPWT